MEIAGGTKDNFNRLVFTSGTRSLSLPSIRLQFLEKMLFADIEIRTWSALCVVDNLQVENGESSASVLTGAARAEDVAVCLRDRAVCCRAWGQRSAWTSGSVAASTRASRRKRPCWATRMRAMTTTAGGVTGPATAPCRSGPSCWRKTASRGRARPACPSTTPTLGRSLAAPARTTTTRPWRAAAGLPRKERLGPRPSRAAPSQRAVAAPRSWPRRATWQRAGRRR